MTAKIYFRILNHMYIRLVEKYCRRLDIYNYVTKNRKIKKMTSYAAYLNSKKL